MSSPEAWDVGVTAGVTVSTLGTNDDVKLDSIWGGMGGVTATHNLNRSVGIQVQALITQRGAKNSVTGTTLRLTYLDLPVLVRLGNTTTDRLHMHAFAGLAPGFKLGGDPSNGAGSLTTDITGKVKTFDLGFPFGVEVEQGAWSVEARYTFGLINVNDGGADITNRGATFNVGYRFR